MSDSTQNTYTSTELFWLKAAYQCGIKNSINCQGQKIKRLVNDGLLIVVDDAREITEKWAGYKSSCITPEGKKYYEMLSQDS